MERGRKIGVLGLMEEPGCLRRGQSGFFMDFKVHDKSGGVMKKNGVASFITLALLLTLSLSAWGATAGFELTFSNLAIRLNNDTISLVPSGVKGYAQIFGGARYPTEAVPAYLEQRFYGTYNLNSSYHGGPWLEEMTASGVYDPITNSANTHAKIVSNAPYPSFERSYVGQVANITYDLDFNSPENGWYQTHISGDYSYTISLDNSGPNTFAELNWSPMLLLGLYPPYSIQPDYGIYDIFADKNPGTHSGHLDLDVGPEIYLFAGNSMKIFMCTDLATQNWGPAPAPVVPIPSSSVLFSTGIFGLAGWRYKRHSTG